MMKRIQVNSAYIDLRESNTGRILDSMRVELCPDTTLTLERLKKRNGLNHFILREACAYSVYSKKTWNALKKFEVCYLYSTKRV